MEATSSTKPAPTPSNAVIVRDYADFGPFTASKNLPLETRYRYYDVKTGEWRMRKPLAEAPQSRLGWEMTKLLNWLRGGNRTEDTDVTIGRRY